MIRRLKLYRVFTLYRVKKTFKENIEAEEILLDAAQSSKLGEQKIEVPISRNNFRLFLGIILIGFLIFSAQAAYLQLFRGSYFSQAAEKNYIRSLPVLASRGIIYDRSMKQLVYNIPSFDLVVSPQDLPAAAECPLVIKEVSELTGVSQEEIKDILRKAELKRSPTAVILETLDHETLLKLEEKINVWPGFRIEKNIARQYVSPLSFSHVLGYMGKLTLAEVGDNPEYFLTEKIGKNGLEAFYEKILRGIPGEKLVEVDSKGRLKRDISESKPQDGRGLVLSLDNFLQESFFAAVSKSLEERKLKKAAVVAIDPKTGGVLAMLSFPTFDNNSFAQRLSAKTYAELAQSPDRPLFNRAISGQYAPGSTIKPLVGAAAIQEKVVTPLTKVNDSNGELVILNQYSSAVAYRFGDWKIHGVVNLYDAIAQSCNVYFYTVGGGYDNIKGLGVERLGKYFRLFGLGKVLGIDLASEGDGLVPSESWKKQLKNEPWYIGDTYHISIGQGDLLVTPLQLAVATAAIVNGGKIVQPHLVDKIIDSDKNVIETIKPMVLSKDFISQANLSIIKEGMRQTVTVGSARLLNDLPVPMGAKTGTAEVVGQRNTNAWATVFAPFDDPQIVIAVLVENAGEGSQVAVPIIKEVLEKYFNR